MSRLTKQHIDDLDFAWAGVPFARIEAQPWRVQTDSPTVCPTQLNVCPRGWVGIYPAGAGDPISTLEAFLVQNRLRPEDLVLIETRRERARDTYER
jgi:hypothetical protein